VFDNYYSDALTDVYFNNRDVFKNLPNLKNLLHKLKIDDPVFTVVILVTGEGFPPHVHPVTHSPWNLLIPVKNTKNSFTQFFKSSASPWTSKDLNHLGEEIIADVYDIDLCEITHEVEVVRPTLINVSVPHGIHNPLKNNGSRHTLSIVINTPGYNPLVDAKDYIK
jgi:hypothetical protein